MRRFLAALLIIGIMGGGLSTVAQTPNSPIYFLMDGDFWKYDPQSGSIQQSSTWGYNEAPLMSPDGTRFAYLSVASVAVAFNRNAGRTAFDVEPPRNVWVWELAIDDAFRLADQPTTATADQYGFVAGGILRRSLAWSPDGNQLAWVEIVPDYRYQLVVYDFNTRILRVLPAEVPFPYADAGYSLEHKILWTAAGIALETFGITEASAARSDPFEQSITVFDPTTGSTRLKTIIGNGTNIARHILNLGDNRIGLLYGNGGRSVLDLNTGNIQPAAPQIELTSQPNANMSLFLGKFLPVTSRYVWDVLWQDGQPFFFETNAPHQAALAPDGEQFVYVDDALYFWGGGGAPVKVAGTDGLADDFMKGVVWGGNHWQEVGTPDACASAPAPRLVIGGAGIVIPGLGGNVLRDLPGKNADGSQEIDTIPPGAAFTVLGGYQCAAGLRWWYVDYDGLLGWTAEGENGVYWLEPR